MKEKAKRKEALKRLKKRKPKKKNNDPKIFENANGLINVVT